ncbi:MAG: tetratricopeptide repeat protein [Deltaproteobacteria bacterium]|nr:tetratricopeptide repeat protein [Deltaproteobacteria bacterium]
MTFTDPRTSRSTDSKDSKMAPSDEMTRAAGPENDALAAAINRAATHPTDDTAWDALEDLAAARQRPEDVAELYRQVLKTASVEVADTLGKRALSFYEEWFGDTPDEIIELLRSLLLKAPELEWAAERLTLLLSVSQRWEELLSVYDQLLKGLKESPRRRKLLEEAAGVAKDFLGSADRAIGYLNELFRSRPNDPHLAASLERLLDKEQRWEDLQTLWVARLDTLVGAEQHEMRARLANLRLDHLGNVAGALLDAQQLLKAREDDAACKVLERILKMPDAAPEQRQTALALLRNDYERLGEKARIVEALETAHEFASGEEKLRLLREASERLTAQDYNVAAMERLVELLSLSPTDAPARVRLRQLAEVAERFDVYVQGLLAAAQSSTDDNLRAALLLEAARVEDDVRGRHSEAITLLQRVTEDAGADQGHHLTALRRLTKLLARYGEPARRLAALETLAKMAPELAEKQAAWGTAAKLATALNDLPRALAAWEARLALSSTDTDALDALVTGLVEAKQWERLTEVLRARAELSQNNEAKRNDLAQLAHVYEDALDRKADATETWLEIERRFGVSVETAESLIELYTQQEQWDALADRLGGIAKQDHVRSVNAYVQLGDVLSLHLERPREAAEAYAVALQLDHKEAGARAGLQALLENPLASRTAVAALARAFDVAGEVPALLALTDKRLNVLADPASKSRVLAELASRVQSTEHDDATARALLGEALVLTPHNAHLEIELLRLCDSSESWKAAADVLGKAASALSDGESRKLNLRLAQGDCLENKAHDAPAALAAYQAALSLAPDRTAVKLAVVRVAGGLEQWAVAAEAMLRTPASTEVVKGLLLPAFEAAIKNAGAWLPACDALAEALAKRTGLPEALARDLELQIAAWCETHAPEAQARMEAALVRAAKQSPTHTPTWERLAQTQRKQPGKPLFATLCHLMTLAPESLDAGSEALRVAQDPLADAALITQRALALLAQASHLMRTDATPAGKVDVGTAVEQSTSALTSLWLSSGSKADALRAVNLQVELSGWPLPTALVRGLRRKAAKLALETLGDKARARSLYRVIVDDAPDDREAMRVLAELLEEADLLSELIALRRRELTLDLPLPERLALRLEMSRVAGLIEARSARVNTLMANLEDAPGDERTLTALGDLLAAKGQYTELADILTTQAKTLEDRGQVQNAAPLWGRVAVLAERHLQDVPRALSSYEKMVALAPTSEALDSLARLCTERAEHRAAAGWLEQRLTSAVGKDRVDVTLRLAHAYLASGQRHRAIGSMERTLAEAPRAHALREQLLATYREAQAWEPLAQALAEGCHADANDEVVLAYAREAAAIYQDKLSQPERAVPVLQMAVERLPGDRWVRTRLAEGLRVAGRNAEARAILEALLEEMGRRRSKERAAIHHQLALVARADNDLNAAIEHLDQAAAMDVGAQDILVDLAETAELAGAFDRAERAYQALLVLARRSDPAVAPISAAETLLRLSSVAAKRGDEAAAAERLDSAMAAALQSVDEAHRLQKAFVRRGEIDRAADLIERRAAAASTGADEALVMCDKARLFDELSRPEEAIAAIALALDKAPDLAEAHNLGRQIASAMNDPRRYLRLVEEALDQMRRRDDGERVCELLLRAGTVAEEDLKDLEKAAAFYTRAEQTGNRMLEVLVAIARVAASRKDKAEESRALRELAKLAETTTAPSEQAEISFKLAELQLRSAQTRLIGLETLSAALDKSPDFARAQAIVQAAQVPEDELPRVMPLYERVARASGDDHMLLDFLERRAAGKEVTQQEVSEAVELALSMGESARAERLLERAVLLAEQRGQAREAAWALLDLAQRKRASGDLRSAFKWLKEAAENSDSPRIPALLRDVAREAAHQTNGAMLATEVYEYLRARNPSDKELWQPLIELYSQLGNEDHLRTVVSDTLEKLLDRNDRIRVRLLWARHLMQNAGDEQEAASVLRDILLEEPGHREALMALAEIHERRGDVSEAVALLSDSLREAESRGDADWQAETSRRLGDLLRKADPAQAKQVYRQALSSNIPDPALKLSLQKSLLDLLDEDEREERAALAEELLAGETGEAAATRALFIATMYRDMGDAAAERRLLNVGRKLAPANPEIFDRLAALLENEQNWDAWADLMDTEATRRATERPEDAAALLRRAAATRREKLLDKAGAAELLKKAAALGSSDIEQVRELAACLREMGDSAGALDVVGQAVLKPGLTDDARVGLYRLRADLHSEANNPVAAVADLEAAFAIAGVQVGEELTDALFLLASRAADADDVEGERKAMLRVAEVFSLQGNGEKAQELLFRWVDNHPEDKAALQALRNRFEGDERWEEVAQVCQRLVGMESGEARVEAALGLAHACELLGRPADAVPSLEAVLADHPGQPAVLNILSNLYEQSGNKRKVAEMRIAAAETLDNEEERLAALTEGADIFLQDGAPEAAVDAINKAFALRPEDRTVQRLLADTLLATGQYAQAYKLLERLVGDGRGMDGGEVCALYHRMARAAGGAGDTENQLAVLKRALDADRRNGVVAAELADLAESLGDDDAALKALRAISLNSPDGPMPVAVSFFRQARIAAKNGDRQRALIFAKRALQEDPKLKEAEALLEQVR